MDVSDGLVADLSKLCRASNVSADIAVARVPLSAAARQAVGAAPALIEPIFTGGEDYEILCTIASDRVEPFCRATAAAGVAVTEIGRILAGNAPPRFLDKTQQVLKFARPGYSHF
jgi:thiamine-monophosphate kinase